MKKILLIIITISGLFFSFMPMAISDVNIPPKGVSQSLWDAYREMTISELDGAKRNFRSASALSVFIKGSPTERDVNVIDSILSAFAQNCQNITPKRATVLPRAGVVFHFIKPSEFKTIIPGTTQKTSAVQWWYYPGTGINDAIALISTDITDLQERDFYIRFRLLNSLGFYHGLTDSDDFNLFGASYRWESQNTLTEMDRQLISFYCSTLVRAWDTEVQTQDYINSLWNKNISTAPSSDHTVKWSNTDSGIEILVEPKGDQTVINHGTKIGYQLVDTNGLVVASDEIDIQDDVFKTRVFQVKDLKSFSTYTLKLYSKNVMGKSPTQNIAVSTRVVISEAAKAAAAKVLADAAAKAAADKVIADAAAAKAADDKVIADAAAAKAAADKVIADAAAAKAAAAKVLADAAAKAAADKVLVDAAVKAAADKVIADAKMQAEKILADAKAAAELKAKQEADVQAKAAQILADAKAKFDAAAKIVSAKKMTTITCVKGKLTKKVTAVKPICPAGYKQK